MFQFCCLDVHQRVPCRRLQVPDELSLLGNPGGSTAAAFTEQGRVTGRQGQDATQTDVLMYNTKYNIEYMSAATAHQVTSS